jgi:hypothetical protein
MLLLAALLVQTAAPDIEVNVRARVREVRVRQRGETSLRVYASPDANSRVEPANRGEDRQMRGRNRTVNIHAEARIADPRTNSPAPETSSPH